MAAAATKQQSMVAAATEMGQQLSTVAAATTQQSMGAGATELEKQQPMVAAAIGQQSMAAATTINGGRNNRAAINCPHINRNGGSSNQ